MTNAQITPKKLIKEHKKSYKPYNDANQFKPSFATLTASMRMGDFEFNAVFYSKGDSSRYDMELMGTQFYEVNLDTLSWSYNPMTKEFEFSRGRGNSMGFIETGMQDDQNNLEFFLADGWEPDRVEPVKLDSIESYKLMLSKDEGTPVELFFDKQNYYLIGVKSSTKHVYYLNYKEIDSYLLPSIFIDKDNESGEMILAIEKYDFHTPIDDSLFVMSEEVRKAYSEFLKPENNSFNKVQQLYDSGKALVSDGNPNEGIKKFNEALKLNSKDVVVLNARGLAFLDIQDYYSAIADFKRAIELSNQPKAEYFNNLGLTKYYLGDNKGALKDYDQALKIDSTNSTIYANLGLLQIRNEKYEDAELNYNKALELDSTSAMSVYYRAFVRSQQGKYNGADADYKIAHDMGVEGAAFDNYWGVAKYQLEDYDSALILFEKAYQQDSSDVQYLINQADTHKQFENGYTKVVDIYSSLIEKDTISSKYYAERALAHYELALYKAARRDIDKAIALYNENALYYDYRAYIKEYSGDYTGAIEDFTLSLNLEQDPNIYYRRGLAKMNISNKFDACKDFKKASELGDENGKAALVEHCKL